MLHPAPPRPKCRPRHLVLLAICALAVFCLLLVSEARVPSRRTVPILLYHHIDDSGEGDSTIAEEVFLSHLDALLEAGYETVSFQQLIDYVDRGALLPKKPVVLTFDDGYRSFYDIAWPALAQRGMCGTCFVVGSSMGKTTYKDTGVPIIPHFSWREAAEMSGSGAASIQTHSFDLHQYRSLEPDGGREGVIPKWGETDGDYRRALAFDLVRSLVDLEEATGERAQVYSYPFGLYSPESEELCARFGFRVTLTTQPQPAVLVRDDPSSLRLLGRYSVDDCPPQELLARLG